MTARLAEILAGYLDLRWRIDPVQATSDGRHEHDGAFSRLDTVSVREHVAALRAYNQSLEEVEPSSLDDEIDRTAALHSARHDLLWLERERPFTRDPSFHLTHVLGGLFLLLVRDSDDVAGRARSLLSRLQGVPEFLDRARESLTRPCAPFLVTAKGILPGGLDLIDAIDPHELDLADVTSDELNLARDQARTALLEFGDAVALMEESADGDFAIGRDLFDRKLHTAHMIQDNADEILRYGKRLKEEATSVLQRLGEEIQPGADWRSVARNLRGDTPTAESAVAEYAAAMRDARAFTQSRGIMHVVNSDLDVIPTPDFLRSTVPFAAYQGPGAFDQNQRGLFFVTLPAPGQPWRGHCRAELASTALHEGIPGHHQHIVTSNGLSSSVRRVLSTPASVEGWALYCESLMAELRFFRTPAERFFQGHHVLWRALRVILDVELHTRGMTPSAASRLLQEELGFDSASADSEVRRYCAHPTYQLCYAVGRREILRLREDAQQSRGSGFDLAGFHDELLSYGLLPTVLARWGMGLS